MPPETDEEFAADAALDAKLGAFFEAEQTTDTAEQAPVEEEATEETPVAEERPRDDQGRFAPKETEETPAEEAERLLAGKYKTAEELEDAYKQLQSRLGTQGQELGELRKQIEETLDSRLGEFQQNQEQRQNAVTAPGLIQQFVEDGRYAEAAQLAAEARSGVLYSQVMNEWMAVEPYNAYSYDNHLRQQQLAAQMQQQTEPLIRNVQQQNVQKEFSDAMTAFSQDKPDMQQVGPEMLKVAEEDADIFQAIVQSGTPQRGLDYLYTKARARISDTLAQAATTAATQAEEESRQAKTQATVGAAATAATSTPKTNVDQWREDFHSVLFDDSTSIRSGLTTD